MTIVTSDMWKNVFMRGIRGPVCDGSRVTLGSPIFSHGFPLRQRGTTAPGTEEGPQSP